MIDKVTGRAPTSVADEVWLRFINPCRQSGRARVGFNQAIDEVLVKVRSAIAKNRVAVSTHLMDGLVPLRGDRVQLQQVVVNLILNAVEAMSSVEDGVRELMRYDL